MWPFRTEEGRLLKLVDRAKLMKVIDQLSLEARQKAFIKARWLNCVLWWDRQSKKSKAPQQNLRAAAAIAGVLTFALVGTSLGNVVLSFSFQLLTFALSLILMVCLAPEGVYHFGTIWREKRDACERIKSEGFRFFQLTGRHGEREAHQAIGPNRPVWGPKEAYRDFANRVEDLIESEISTYIRAVSEDAPGGSGHRAPVSVTRG